MSALPANLASNPRLDLWIGIDEDGTIALRTGKVEIGQGAVTAIAAIAAAELGLPPERVRISAGDTRSTPDEGHTAGSLSIEHGGAAMRHAAALVRTLFAECAAQALGVSPDAITIDNGVFKAPGTNENRSYEDLASTVDLARSAQDLPAPVLLAPPLGDSGLARRDLPAKFSGAAFIQDMDVAGLVHARVLRPPHPHARLVSIDREAVERLTGVVALVVDGSFVAVAAARDDQAAKAVEVARGASRWERVRELPPFTPTNAWMEDEPAISKVLVDEHKDPAGGQNYEATFARPYMAHASIGPCCALAEWTGTRLQVYTHSQGVFPLRGDLARAFRMPAADIDVIHAQGAGCYGHNGADDVALDAALVARAVLRPVMCQWSRADELSWSPFGAAMRGRVTARLDADGRIAAWTYDVWSPPHVARPGGSEGVNLLAAQHVADAQPPSPVRDIPQPSGSGDRNAIPIYDLPGRRITHHRLPQGPVRSSALRSLGAHLNVFAIESAMDDLAVLARQDPLAFRLAHLRDARARAVLEEAARMGKFAARGPGGDGIGVGLGVARYKGIGGFCAVVAHVEITEKVLLRGLYAAADVGRVVHRDGVLNQIEGGIVQSASWTLKEAVRWDADGILPRTWDDYPILGFAEVPPIEVNIIDRPDAPPLGAGECAAGPTAAAIGNAVAHALGVRVRTMPLTPEQIADAISAAPV